jgi:hypothetical protein
VKAIAMYYLQQFMFFQYWSHPAMAKNALTNAGNEHIGAYESRAQEMKVMDNNAQTQALAQFEFGVDEFFYLFCMDLKNSHEFVQSTKSSRE